MPLGIPSSSDDEHRKLRGRGYAEGWRAAAARAHTLMMGVDCGDEGDDSDEVDDFVDGCGPMEPMDSFLPS